MELKRIAAGEAQKHPVHIYLITHEKAAADLQQLAGISAEDASYVLSRKNGSKTALVHLVNNQQDILFHFVSEGSDVNKTIEKFRQAGHQAVNYLKNTAPSSAAISGQDVDTLLAYAEGCILSSYKFLKYKKKQDSTALISLSLVNEQLTETDLHFLEVLAQATYVSRNLVNEPHSFLTATRYSSEIERLGKESGYTTEVFNKAKITSLKMGGLLAVNKGSEDPPTFNILTWKPEDAVNEKPIILIGKGVVYDTGGMSLKPTPNSMDKMKSDMGGSASVVGALYGAAKANLPLYIIGLIPATDNRPGQRAIVPGDVITMYDGTTVEVMNTDAEGRLILADALTYAKKYNPELVIDLATLTGAAFRALGTQAMAMMGTAQNNEKSALLQSGFEVHERMVEFPLWEEYGRQLGSDIADLKNIGGPQAGAITAGKFLEHFTAYPWIHLDIAGPAYLDGEDSYRGKNGTGIGVRLLLNFFKNRIRNYE